MHSQHDSVRRNVVWNVQCEPSVTLQLYYNYCTEIVFGVREIPCGVQTLCVDRTMDRTRAVSTQPPPLAAAPQAAA